MEVEIKPRGVARMGAIMNLIEELQSSVRGQHLLNHPFYQRWSAGELSKGELQEYARQYYHYSLAFPTFLSAIHANSDDLSLRQAVLENLIEEERGPENHPELWLRFCDSLGLDREDVLSSIPNEETRSLIGTMKGLAADGEAHEGLSALYAYESQVPAVAATKIDGLRRFYEIEDPRAISFFSVHQEADVLHSKTAEDLLSRLCEDEPRKEEAVAAATLTLAALYRFLDGVTTPAAATCH